MRRPLTLLALAVLLAVPAALHAQRPGGGPPDGPPKQPGPGGPPGPGVEFLLAHTGELQLTDAQVVKLAAIARRAETRRRALRATMDSLRATQRPPEPGAPPPAPPRQFEQAREADRTDLREAIAVLTPDQQATAWQIAGERRGLGRGPR